MSEELPQVGSSWKAKRGDFDPVRVVKSTRGETHYETFPSGRPIVVRRTSFLAAFAPVESGTVSGERPEGRKGACRPWVGRVAWPTSRMWTRRDLRPWRVGWKAARRTMPGPHERRDSAIPWSVLPPRGSLGINRGAARWCLFVGACGAEPCRPSCGVCIKCALNGTHVKSAPPLSPATPSAELIAAADELRKFGTCACGPEMLKRHPDCKGCQVATAYDEARAKVSSTAPATPSVTVEEAVTAYLREYNAVRDPGSQFVDQPRRAEIAGIRAVLALSLPRALGRENEKGEGA